MSLDEISGLSGVSYATVRNVLLAAGVRPRRKDNRVLPGSGFQILAKLLKGEQASQIATDMGVTRQRVHEVKMKARASGIDI